MRVEITPTSYHIEAIIYSDEEICSRVFESPPVNEILEKVCYMMDHQSSSERR
jgi:hypothetical protein